MIPKLARRNGHSSVKLQLLHIGCLSTMVGFALLFSRMEIADFSGSLRRSMLLDETDKKMCTNLTIKAVPMLDSWEDQFQGAPTDDTFRIHFQVAADTSVNNVEQIVGRIHHEGDKFRLMEMDLAVTHKKIGKNLTDLIAIDVGANRGIWSYGMAARGLEVHSFEISPDIFKLLQHGKRFNPKSVNDRVHLYPMGMSDTVASYAIEGVKEGAHLVPSDDGDILGLTFDCFAEQTQMDHKRIAFLKVDAEGFDIKFLQGSQNSLFRKDVHIPSFTMEINPHAWTANAGTSIQEAINEIKIISHNFKHVYMIPVFNTDHVIEHFKKNLIVKEPLVVGKLQLWKLTEPDEIDIAINNGTGWGDVWMSNNADLWDFGII